MKDLSIIIVNYNTTDYLKNCLFSIESGCNLDYEVIVVDNSSTDGVAEMLAADFPSTKLVVNQENLGFARANNQGMRIAGGNYIILLNPDTIVLPGALENMVQCLESNSQIGAVGPRAFIDDDMTLQISTNKPPDLLHAILEQTIASRIFPNASKIRQLWEVDWQYWLKDDQLCEVPGIGGAYFMLSAELARKLDYMDEHYFLGYEDTDWSYRIRRSGYKIAVEPKARIIHYFGQSKLRHAEKIRDLVAWDKGLLCFLSKRYKRSTIALFKSCMFASNLVRLGSAHLKGLKRVIEEASETVKPEDGITLRWEGSCQTEHKHRYLLEISNSVNFIDKFASFPSEALFAIKPQVLQRFAKGAYFWRVYDLSREDWSHAPLASSSFRL